MKRLKRSGARLLARAVLSQARSDWEHDVRHHEVEAVLDGKLIERRCGLFGKRSPGLLTLRQPKCTLDDISVIGKLRGGLHQARVGGGITRRKARNPVEIAGIGNHDRHGLELIEQAGWHRLAV